MKVKMHKVLTELEENDIEEIAKTGTFAVPEDIDEIGDEACLDCTEIKNIVFSQNLKRIGKFAFSDCKNLEVIRFYSTPQIEENAFADCPIDTVIIPAEITGVDLDEFYSALKKAINNDFKLFIDKGQLANEKIKFGNTEEPENE